MADEPVQPEAKPDEGIGKVIESINSIGETLEAVTERISGLEEKLTAPTEPEPKPEEKPAEGWQPKTWDDIPKLIDEKGKEIAEQTIAEREKAAKEAEEARSAEVKEIDAEFDRQLEELEGKGIIPKIQNQDDQNDPGRIARKELFGRAAMLGTVNLLSVGNDLHQLHENGLSYETGTNKVIRSKPNVAGMDSPVGSSSNRGYSGHKQGPSYKEIHEARSMDEIINRFDNA